MLECPRAKATVICLENYSGGLGGRRSPKIFRPLTVKVQIKSAGQKEDRLTESIFNTAHNLDMLDNPFFLDGIGLEHITQA